MFAVKDDAIIAKLNILLEENEILHLRVCSLEKNVIQTRNISQELLTLIRRLSGLVDSAMKTLHKAFKMTLNGILNLREEQSEFAGTVLSDFSFV
jgi:hypothetical protein